MPFIRSSVNGFLNEVSQFVPVNRLFKPNLLQAQSNLLQPVLNFRMAPLVDQLIGVEIFAVEEILAGAQNKINWSSATVPAEEIHRYVGIYISHNSAASKEFRLLTRGQRGPGPTIFFSGIDIRHNIATALRVNLLCDQPVVSVGTCNKTRNVLDLYPGMSFQIDNSENLDLLSTVTIQGYRLKMRGPLAVGGTDVSGDITGTAS